MLCNKLRRTVQPGQQAITALAIIITLEENRLQSLKRRTPHKLAADLNTHTKHNDVSMMGRYKETGRRKDTGNITVTAKTCSDSAIQ